MVDRFWDKVQKGDEESCWEWLAHTDRAGYGRYWEKGRMTRAHRYALNEISPVPFKGAHCLHSCDNPRCCNPSHLSWGTDVDNKYDKVKKGRHIKGETHPNSVYKNEIADSIIRLKMQGYNVREIADTLGLTVGGVMNVYVGRAWKHRHGIDGNPTLEQMKLRKADRRKPRAKRQDTSSPPT